MVSTRGTAAAAAGRAPIRPRGRSASPAPAPRPSYRRPRASAGEPAVALPAVDALTAIRVREVEQRMEQDQRRIDQAETYAIQDREDSRIRLEAESQARITAITARPYAPPVAAAAARGLGMEGYHDDTIELGELTRSPEGMIVKANFPLVPPKQLWRVYKYPNFEYDMADIYKLVAVTATNVVLDEYEAIHTQTGERWVKRRGQLKDYATPAVWSNAFLQWQAIRISATKDVDLFLRTFKFHQHLMRLSECYEWNGVLDLAFHLMNLYHLDCNATWTIPEDERALRCVIKAPRPAIRVPAVAGQLQRAPRAIRQVDPGQPCRNWNSGRCPEPCVGGRRHDICNFKGCTLNHPAYLHHSLAQ